MNGTKSVRGIKMKTLFIKPVTSLLTLAVIITLTGCATVPPPPLPAIPVLSEQVVTTLIRCSVNPPNGNPLTIQEGDVKISINPKIVEDYTRKKQSVDISRQYRLLGNTPSSCWGGCDRRCNVVAVDMADYYSYSFGGRKLYFYVTIENKLPIPLRLDSSIIAVSVGPKEIPIEKYRSNYEGFRQGLILPGQTWSFTFDDPSFSDAVTDGTKIRIGIYDIPVKVNDNSESIKKGRWNFDFNFTCTTEVKKEPKIVRREMRLINSSGGTQIKCAYP